MDLINNLSLGFSVAFTMQNLMYAFVGCFLGTLIGVLPGVGPVATIAMLLPATYALPPVAALIMLAAWRGSALAVTRAKYRPAPYDDERQRARSTPSQSRPAVQPGIQLPVRDRSRG